MTIAATETSYSPADIEVDVLHYDPADNIRTDDGLRVVAEVVAGSPCGDREPDALTWSTMCLAAVKAASVAGLSQGRPSRLKRMDHVHDEDTDGTPMYYAAFSMLADERPIGSDSVRRGAAPSRPESSGERAPNLGSDSHSR